MAEVRKCQVLDSGAGPGGYVAGIRSGQLGLGHYCCGRRQGRGYLSD